MHQYLVIRYALFDYWKIVTWSGATVAVLIRSANQQIHLGSKVHVPTSIAECQRRLCKYMSGSRLAGPARYKDSVFVRHPRMKDLAMCRAILLLPIHLALGACMLSHADEEPAPVPTMSVNELMETVVTPATNTLWGIEDPQSDEDWQVFIDAANLVIEAARTIKVGGTGENDMQWAADPEWQAFADRLQGAGVDARVAAENKDLEAMYTVGEVLYPPCEECHIQFHPGVREN
jgi:hypothetical protein